jgi:UMF1 family MFS transporter
MFFVTPGRIALGMLVFILAEIGYRASQVFYNGLLPEIADPDEMAEVSGNGWAVGSLGGILCLLIVLVPIVLTEGRDNANLIVRLSFVFTAVFWVLSAIPIFRWLKERAEPQSLPAGENYLTIAVSRLRKTFKSVRRFREYIKFLIAFLVYNDGIIIALDFAAILGATLYGMSQTNLIIFMIIVQIFNVVGAYLFGIMAKRVSSKATLMVSLLMMVVAGIWIIFNQTVVGFYLIGMLAGVAMAGVQSVSRTMVGLMTPAGQSAEFFAIFAITGKTSSFIGPFVFAQTVFYLTRYYEGQGLVGTLAEQQGHRIAVWTIVAFLLIGMGLLTLVNERKGKEAAVSVPELIPA